MATAAQQLQGMMLVDGWKVTEHIQLDGITTGGYFSEAYVVEHPTGRRAFLKALDYSGAMNAPDPARALQALTETFNVERDLLIRCTERRLDRVVSAITHGTIRVPSGADGGVVQYIIFELADGDLRARARLSAGFDLAWVLRALHHAATGMWQLHQEGIAHQDLKPSNLLVFDGKLTKVADLGRAAFKGAIPPHEGLDVPGDAQYAPPELLYGYVDPEWERRRLGGDAYLLGSMIVFCFTGAGMTVQLHAGLAEGHQWRRWGGTFEDVLPYVREAFEVVMDTFANAVPESVRDQVVNITRELCEPDPRLRGNLGQRLLASSQYSLERYVTRLDLAARRAETAVRREAVGG